MADKKVLQQIMREILESGDYTLDGIAHSTRIPIDVIFDAVCGHRIDFSNTFWVKMMGLYLQIKPELFTILLEKLLEMRDKNQLNLAVLLDEV